MSIEIIKSGQWLFTERGTPEYSIYKLLKGKVSIHKSGKKIREVEINEGMKPIMLGITAVLRDDRQHMASVKAESDIEVDKIFVDQIRGVLSNEIPKNIKYDISTMIESIITGNEIISLINKYSDLSCPDLKVPDNLSPETSEILSEIMRLYKLIDADVRRFLV